MMVLFYIYKAEKGRIPLDRKEKDDRIEDNLIRKAMIRKSSNQGNYRKQPADERRKGTVCEYILELRTKRRTIFGPFK